MTPHRFVAYYRVSTDKQSASGLGLEAQSASITAHAVAAGRQIIASYTEIETGKRDTLDNRPELRKAIAHGASPKRRSRSRARRYRKALHGRI